MSVDGELIDLLATLREAAATSLSFKWTPRDRWPSDLQDIWNLAEPVAEALKEHTEFKDLQDRFFMGRQLGFHPNIQAANLLEMTTRIGPNAAIEWYRKVISTQTTGIRVVGQVFGLHADEPHIFSNGVKLLPASTLPDSPNSTLLKQGFAMAPGQDIPSALMIEIEGVPFEHDGSSHDRHLEIANLMRRMMNAYALADRGSPIVAETWTEFTDRDLEAAEFGRTWQSNRTDGARPSHGVNVTSDAVEWVERYLQLPTEVMKACDVPLARLNIANRRISPGDQALDGSICLEALLSGRGRGELTHKLAVRTALLLGKTLDEREAISKKVRKFYELRSAVVHGSGSKNADLDRATASEGLGLCRSALRAIIENRTLPEPELWELTGGPSWNRLK